MTDSELRTSDGDDKITADAVMLERATGVLILALQQPPGAVVRAFKAAAQRHDVPMHELADAIVTAAQGGQVPSPALRKVLWAEWGDLLQ